MTPKNCAVDTAKNNKQTPDPLMKGQMEDESFIFFTKYHSWEFRYYLFLAVFSRFTESRNRTFLLG